MSELLTPHLILEALLPYLKVAAAYARKIQPLITARPDKEHQGNFFAAALTDADLAIQNLVEVALLGTFPQIRFYGEEHEHSSSTKYFRAIDLGPQDDYLVTLDPIDGTRFYLDGHSNYQIILSVLNWDDFEAVIALSPALNTYYYALRGKGAFKGALEVSLEACTPLQVTQPKPTVFLGWGMDSLKPILMEHYDVITVATAYSHEVQIPNVNGVLSGELAGAVIRAGKFIDGAALAFLAQEAGCIVTTHSGSPLPPLHTCSSYSRPGLVIASSTLVHQRLLEALRQQ